MKIKEDYILREVASSYVVVPIGKESEVFHGMITLNESGAFLWKLMQEDCTKEELVKSFLERYDATEEQAINSVEKFWNIVVDNKFVEA